MIDDLKALAVFAKTVELGSFRDAARALGLSPSVISHHVSRLERSLGVPLLYRTTRSLAPTVQGSALFQAAREMVAVAQRGVDMASARGGGPTGTLRVTAPAILAETRFADDLGAFLRAHPNVRVVVGFSEQRRDLLRDGYDLALRIGKLADSSLRTRRIAMMPRVLVASPAYVAARRKPAAPADLATWDFIQLSAIPPVHALHPPGKRAVVQLEFGARIAVDSALAMRALALAGCGVTSLPAFLAAPGLERGDLVRVLPAWRLTSMPVSAVWPVGTLRPELTLRFVDFIAPGLAELLA